MCECSLEPENTTHFLLHCHNYDNVRNTLMGDLNIIDPTLNSLRDIDLVHLLLFGDPNYNLRTNQNILKATINFLKKSTRFDEALF